MSRVLELLRRALAALTIEHIVVAVLLMLHQLHFSLQSRVEMILDVIVSAARQEFCDFRPTIAELPVILYDDAVLFLGPLVFLDVGIEVIMPPTNVK